MNLPVLPAHRSLPVSRFRFPLPTFHYLHRLFLLFTLLATLCTPTNTNATVVIPVADTDLAQQASVIVIGRITKLKSAWEKNHQQIFTKITLSVDEVLKGNLKKRRVTVTQAGGIVDDVQFWIDGNPEFTVGEKVLLFLAKNNDGGLTVLHMYQGKFSVFTDTDSGMEMAYREAHPEGVRMLSDDYSYQQRSVLTSTDMETSDSDNGFLPLADLKTRIQNALSHPQTTFPSQLPIPSTTSSPTLPTPARKEAPFALLGSPAARWFEPDSGQFVTMKINPTASLAGATTATQSALATWTGVSGSSFKFQYGGTTTATGLKYDGENAISFGDLFGQISPPSVSQYVNPSTGRPYCSGVLAIGGYFRSGSITTTINGQTYYKIIEGDLVFADGWDGCENGFSNALNVAEIATHELGHTMGLGHSADADATMYAYAHFDGRGAAIREDDIAGLRSIYPAPPSPAPSTCSYTVSSTGVSVGSEASLRNITVTPSASTCSWTATSNAAWITITAGASRTGTGYTTISIAANTAATSRSGTLTIAGKTVTITQAGTTSTPTCSFAVPTPISVSAGNVGVIITVSASSSTCPWTIANIPSWIIVTSGTSGTGMGTVSLTITANASTTARSATLIIAGKSVTVTQAGASTTATCTYTLSSTGVSVSSTATLRNITVTPSASTCSWTATSNAAWITITAGASRTGTGYTTISIAANTAATSRSGTLTIAGKTVTIKQSGSSL